MDELKRKIIEEIEATPGWSEAIADRILEIPEIAEALRRPKPINTGHVEITGTGKGNRRHIPPPISTNRRDPV